MIARPGRVQPGRDDAPSIPGFDLRSSASHDGRIQVTEARTARSSLIRSTEPSNEGEWRVTASPSTAFGR